MRKIYYRIKFKNVSAMNLSNGENNNTDKDICRNSLGNPYIPGSSLAGVYRSLFEADKQDVYFGRIGYDAENGERNIKSKIVVYDANVVGKYRTSIRDCVSLDEFKTSIAGAKMDFEVLDPYAKFVTYIETEDEVIGDTIVNYWKSNGLSFGGKTQRGLGRCEIDEVDVAKFDLPDDRWLDFDMYEDNGYKKYKFKECVSYKTSIKLSLKQVGGLSIRQYSTRVNKATSVEPDYEQLCYMRDGMDVAYIPGTTWAGAFRHRMLEIDSNCSEYFGSTSQKSNILFSDSELVRAKFKLFTRNAIDRFTDGPKDGALYNERFVYGGTTDLIISFSDGDKEFKKALAAAISDLHYGFMAIGGLTSIGRGLFEVVKINGMEVEDNIYHMLLKELGV